MSLETQELSAKGSRRLTLTMMAVRNQADRFEGVARGSAKPLRLLAAFQEAEPYLGLPSQSFKLLAWLVKMTKDQDWEAGSRPIAWPSADRQAEFLGLSLPRVKILNRLLYEAGVFVMRDSPTGKRYGRRDPDGRIIEGYGFDLSPLAIRYEEFVRLAAEARAIRERIRDLKTRATCARRAIAQIGETLGVAGALPQGWSQFASETAELVDAIRRAATGDDLELILKDLEARKVQAESWARELSGTVNECPVGLADKPLTITTNLSPYLADTVEAAKKHTGGAKTASMHPEAAPKLQEPIEEAVALKDTTSLREIGKIYPGELLKLIPRLADHVPQQFPEWTDIVAAAGGALRRDLGISQSLWGEACLAVGRHMAALTLAVVSTKPREHFTRGAGGYFAAMIKRAKQGELRLDRSLWKLRRDHLGRVEKEAAARTERESAYRCEPPGHRAKRPAWE